MGKTLRTYGLVIVLCVAAAAAKKFPMTSASIVPGAQGRVEIDKDKNGNVKLEMTVVHLANPANLTPPASVYIVWLQARDGMAENQGQLRVDKKESGSFKTVTPSKNFDIFVTAEADSNVKAPSGAEVLRATIQP